MLFDKKTYLIIPSVPTPNGRLHLGHIGGPFLSADIFARFVRTLGHQAQIIAGTDSYESYVTLQAWKEQKLPEEICHYYHQGITEDLNLFHIDIDEMINPLEEKWHEEYKRWHLNILETLQQNNAITQIKEKILWDKNNHRYQMGCWLNGYCPSCDTPITGYFCEKCGAHFRPEEAKPSLHENLIVTETSNLFMKVPLSEDLSKKGISSNIEKTYQNYLQHQQGLLRLTTNSEWGIALPRQYNLSQSTLFNYGCMFSYFLLMGEIAGQLNGTKKMHFQ